MSLPTLVTVKGVVSNSAGPVAGRLVFARDTTLFPAATDDESYSIPEEVVVVVGADGVFSQPLYSNNDPAASPVDWTWEVRTHFAHWNTTFNVVVPYDAPGAEVNLNQLAPVPPDGDGELYALVSHTHEGGGGGEGPAVSNTVASETAFGQASNAGNVTTYSRGNHTHGTPAAPTAASVGADASGTAAAAVAAHVAASDPHTQYSRVYVWDGDSYEVATGAEIYVGPTDPGAVANGSQWIDTDA